MLHTLRYVCVWVIISENIYLSIYSRKEFSTRSIFSGLKHHSDVFKRPKKTLCFQKYPWTFGHGLKPTRTHKWATCWQVLFINASMGTLVWVKQLYSPRAIHAITLIVLSLIENNPQLTLSPPVCVTFTKKYSCWETICLLLWQGKQKVLRVFFGLLRVRKT